MPSGHAMMSELLISRRRWQSAGAVRGQKRRLCPVEDSAESGRQMGHDTVPLYKRLRAYYLDLSPKHRKHALSKKRRKRQIIALRCEHPDMGTKEASARLARQTPVDRGASARRSAICSTERLCGALPASPPHGEIKWQGELVYLSKALIDEPVGIAETHTGRLDGLVTHADRAHQSPNWENSVSARPGRTSSPPTGISASTMFPV